jgi:hypothetical protein
MPDMTNPSSTKNLSERLLAGARMLGNLWRRGKRCQRAWALGDADLLAVVTPLVFGGCTCDPRTDFCKARWLWITLAVQAEQDLADGDHGLALSMNPAQWDATGLTITLPVADDVNVAVGPKGSMSMRHFRELSKDPAAAQSIFSLLKVFPKARVEGIVEPAPEAVV